MAATIGTLIHTWLNGKRVGVDEFGNRYYEATGRVKAGERRRRWVLYHGRPEASKIPAYWHGWMHYTTDAVPDSATTKRYRWQKPHLPNLTGTKYRYLPKGHLQAQAKRAASAADYQAWTPGE